MESTLSVPKFEGEVAEVAKSIVSWVDRRVERRQWSNEEIDAKFAKRGARQIVEEGHTCYMNPCLDFSLVAYQALKASGLDPVFAVQELRSGSYPFNRLHFADEFYHGGGKYFLDFDTMKIVYFSKGDFYNHRKEIESLKVVRVLGDIDPEKDIVSNLSGQFSPESFNLEQQLARLKQDNTPETYAKYLAALGENRALQLYSDL